MQQQEVRNEFRKFRGKFMQRRPLISRQLQYFGGCASCDSARSADNETCGRGNKKSAFMCVSRALCANYRNLGRI